MLCFSKQDIMFAYIKIMLSEKWKLPGVRIDNSEIRRFFILVLEWKVNFRNLDFDYAGEAKPSLQQSWTNKIGLAPGHHFIGLS